MTEVLCQVILCQVMFHVVIKEKCLSWIFNMLTILDAVTEKFVFVGLSFLHNALLSRPVFYVWEH